MHIYIYIKIHIYIYTHTPARVFKAKRRHRNPLISPRAFPNWSLDSWLFASLVPSILFFFFFCCSFSSVFLSFVFCFLFSFWICCLAKNIQESLIIELGRLFLVEIQQRTRRQNDRSEFHTAKCWRGNEFWWSTRTIGSRRNCLLGISGWNDRVIWQRFEITKTRICGFIFMGVCVCVWIERFSIKHTSKVSLIVLCHKRAHTRVWNVF